MTAFLRAVMRFQTEMKTPSVGETTMKPGYVSIVNCHNVIRSFLLSTMSINYSSLPTHLVTLICTIFCLSVCLSVSLSVFVNLSFTLPSLVLFISSILPNTTFIFYKLLSSVYIRLIFLSRSLHVWNYLSLSLPSNLTVLPMLSLLLFHSSFFYRPFFSFCPFQTGHLNLSCIHNFLFRSVLPLLSSKAKF